MKFNIKRSWITDEWIIRGNLGVIIHEYEVFNILRQLNQDIKDWYDEHLIDIKIKRIEIIKHMKITEINYRKLKDNHLVHAVKILPDDEKRYVADREYFIYYLEVPDDLALLFKLTFT